MPYLTTVTLKVLSLDPIPDEMTLADIYRETIEGDYSGDYDQESLPIGDSECKRLLVEQGSDICFFYPKDDQDCDNPSTSAPAPTGDDK